MLAGLLIVSLRFQHKQGYTACLKISCFQGMLGRHKVHIIIEHTSIALTIYQNDRTDKNCKEKKMSD